MFSGGGYDVCLGPYCLQLDAPVIPADCGDGVITPGTGEVCDGNPVVWANGCDDYTVDGCDWGTTITDCDSFWSTFPAQQNLKCSRYCKFDISACAPIEAEGDCGDGNLDWNETCEFRDYTGQAGYDFTNPGNIIFRDVEYCSQIDRYDTGRLLCVPPDRLGACHLNASECGDGPDNVLVEMYCGVPHYVEDPPGNYILVPGVSCNDSFDLIPMPRPSAMCENPFTNCVYATEANETPPGAFPTCHGPDALTQNADGDSIVCSMDNRWCLEGFRYDNALPGCVDDFALCDYGLSGSMTHGCEDIESIIDTPEWCLNDFDGTPNEPYQPGCLSDGDGPTYCRACCIFLEISGFNLARTQTIVVY